MLERRVNLPGASAFIGCSAHFLSAGLAGFSNGRAKFPEFDVFSLLHYDE
jgi:hypothetical protein